MKTSWIFFSLFTAFLWGLYYTSLEQIIKKIDKNTCIVIFSLTSVIFYSFFLKDTNKDISTITTTPSLQGWLLLAFVSSVIAGYMTLLAIETSNATLAAALEITYPFWCMIFAFLFFGLQITWVSAFGVLITFIGVFIVTLGQK